MKRLPVEKKTAAGFWLALIFLTLFGIGGYWNIARGSSSLALSVITAGGLFAFVFLGAAWQAVQRDIAQHAQMEEALAKTNEKLTAVLDASTPVALIAMNAHGAITFFNSGAERLLGYSADEAVEKMAATDFFLDPEITAAGKKMTATTGRALHGFDVLVEGAQKAETVESEWTLVRKDGSHLMGSLAVTAMRGDGGTVSGFMMVARDITGQKHSEQLLRTMNDDLRAFAYTVSHDLKTPLRGISGYAQEIERQHSAGLPERALFCLSQILTATGNLNRLIDDLLFYSRVDAELPRLSDVNVVKLIEGILRDRSSEIAERGVKVEMAIPFTTVHTWERGLVQVLANLIDNALKYSRDRNPPQIRFGGRATDEACRISIADNGIGFDMKYHERIFGLFNRLVRPDEFEGTGAGLAIAKKLLDKLQGKIWAKSEPGGGAIFYIELPRETELAMNL